MKLRTPSLVLAFVALLAAPALGAPGPDQAYRSLLSRDRIGAAAFTRAHPTWDGRGAVVIAVLDTGVDTTLPGLRQTSDGQVKVVEARDFSGQGDVELGLARRVVVDGETLLRTDAGEFIPAPEDLASAPIDGRYWLGFLEESVFRNSETPDVNANGRTDDRFAMLVVRTGTAAEPFWVLYPDGNGDGRIEKERPLRNYVEAREVFSLGGADPRDAEAPLTFAPTVVDEGARPTLSLHFTDGSHGSHCAGIAAGYSIRGEEGFDGIAPGARVLSLKIGDNTLAGGSTTTESMKKALEYAAKWSETHGDFVVVSMSYGIASEMEGLHAIDKLIDELVVAHPRFAVVTSAGNEGPGYSTVGTPAGATLAFAVGALLPRDGARDLYGARIDGDRMFSFSSRGGELDKPDAVAPGVALSTVPDWEAWDIFRGTSMAAPQVAGAAALLASAAAAEELTIDAGQLYRALRHTGRRLDDYPDLAQGGGLVDVPAAYDALRKAARRDGGVEPLGYRISTRVPTQPGGEAPAAYWRTGGYAPKPPLGQTFSVAAMLPRTFSAEQRNDFHGLYDLRSEASWIKVDRRQVALRGETPRDIVLTYATQRLTKPGVYTGRVVATPAKGSRSRAATAFALTTTVIVPHKLGPAEGYRFTRASERLAMGDLRRWFFMVPPGATTMDVELSPRDNDFAWLQLYVFDQAGRQLPLAERFADSVRRRKARATVGSDLLEPGATYEVVAYADYRLYGAAGEASTFDLDVRFAAVSIEEPAFTIPAGGPPTGIATLRSLLDERFLGRAEAVVEGVQRSDAPVMEGDVFEHPFELGGPHRAVRFELEMAPHDYARFTDIAVNILDSSGNAVAQGGFMGVRAIIELALGERVAAGSYVLQVRGGLARDEDEPVPLTLVERYTYAAPVRASVTAGGASDFALYPGVPLDLAITLAEIPPQAPDGFEHSGKLRLVPAGEDRTWYTTRFTFGALPAEED